MLENKVTTNYIHRLVGLSLGKFKDKLPWYYYRLRSLFEGPCDSCEQVKRQSLLVSLSIMTSLLRTIWLMWGSWKTKPLGAIIDYDLSLKDHVAHMRKLKDKASWCHYRLWPRFEGQCGSCEEVERQSLLVSLSIMTSLWRTMWLMWASWKTKPLGAIIDYDLSLKAHVAHVRKLKDKASFRAIIDYGLSLKDHVTHVSKLKDKASWYHYWLWPLFEGPCGSCEEVIRQSLLVPLSIMISLWRTMWFMWGSWKTKPLGIIIDYDLFLKDHVAHVRKLKDKASWYHYRWWPLFEGPHGSCEEVERQSL